MDYLEEYKEYLTYDRRLKPSTVKGYLYCAKAFLIFLSGDAKEASKEDIRGLIKYLEAKSQTQSSISRYITSLRSFYNWMYYEFKTDQTRDLSFFLNKILRTCHEYSAPQIPSYNETEMLRTAMQSYKTAFSFNKSTKEYKMLLRDIAVIEIFRSTGARSNEIKHLLLEDLDLENKNITIRKGKGSRQRVSIFGDLAFNAIKEYIDIWKPEPGQFLFKHTRFNLFYHIIKRWSVRAGINPKIYVHSLRYSHVTQAHKDGVSIVAIANQVGHRNINTTFGYMHLDIDFRREQYHKNGALK